MALTDLEQLRACLLDFPGARQETPFGPEVLVYKVGNKIFAILGWEQVPLAISLKCDPDNARFLREHFPAVRPGYHLNKKHWNTVTLDGSIADDDIRKMIVESYELVQASLNKIARAALESGQELSVRR